MEYVRGHAVCPQSCFLGAVKFTIHSKYLRELDKNSNVLKMLRLVCKIIYSGVESCWETMLFF